MRIGTDFMQPTIHTNSYKLTTNKKEPMYTFYSWHIDGLRTIEQRHDAQQNRCIRPCLEPTYLQPKQLEFDFQHKGTHQVSTYALLHKHEHHFQQKFLVEDQFLKSVDVNDAGIELRPRRGDIRRLLRRSGLRFFQDFLFLLADALYAKIGSVNQQWNLKMRQQNYPSQRPQQQLHQTSEQTNKPSSYKCWTSQHVGARQELSSLNRKSCNFEFNVLETGFMIPKVPYDTTSFAFVL